MAFISPTLPLRSSSLSPTRSFSTTRHTHTHLKSPQMSTLPPRLQNSPLPNVYVYDHCPFCVRVRHVLGHKNIKHNVIWLANDDVFTPTSLIGKKMVPIFQARGAAGASQGESLDIITAIDADPTFGATAAVRPPSGRTDIAQWFANVAMPLRRLTRVRFSMAPLPEFVFREARETYVERHPLKDPEDYDENYARSGEYIAQIQERLEDLAKMVWSKEFCSEGGFSYDDVDLFPRVRSMTIVKGLVLPEELREYVEYQAERAEVPLYDYCAN